MEALSGLRQAVRAGDRAAFDEAVKPYRRRLLQQADKLMGTKLRGLMSAEDLVQEALLNAYRFLAQGSPVYGNSIDAWLNSILKNVVTTAQRRHFVTKKRKSDPISLHLEVGRTSSDGAMPLGHQIATGDKSPSASAARREFVGQLPELLARLRAERRAVLQLIYLDEKPCAEVAQILNKTEAATRKLLSRALDDLATLLPRRSNS